MPKKWWERKWYWALCAILPLLCAPFVPYLMEGVDLTGSIIMAIPISAGVLFAYFVRRGGSLHLWPMLLGTTILGAVIADILMKRRGYRPFM